MSRSNRGEQKDVDSVVVFTSYCIFVSGNMDILVLWEETAVDYDTCFGGGSGGVCRDDDLCRTVMDLASIHGRFQKSCWIR